MGRRKRGNTIDGWVIVDKPLGLTSTQVVSRVRRAFDARKAGHAGTLDPLATGLLAVALGEATKTIPVVTDAAKGYRFTVRWGVATATDDAEGVIVATSDKRPDAAAIRAALPDFTGDIMQVPPRFSAIKLDGERAYDLAREGGTVVLAARPLHVSTLELVSMPDADHAVFDMVCGKGGYVRAIARDLGVALGCHGHVTALRRAWSGPFAETDMVALESVVGDPDPHLRPVWWGLRDLPSVAVREDGAAHLRQGRPIDIAPGALIHGDEAWAAHDGAPVALGCYRGGMFHPTRVFA